MADALTIDQATFATLVEHAWSDFPFEVCGMLGLRPNGSAVHFPIDNAQRSMTNYTMDARQQFLAMRQIEDDDLQLVLYHSHTHTQAYPSETDIRLAAYPEAIYLIVTLQDRDVPAIRAFTIIDGQVVERELVVAS